MTHHGRVDRRIPVLAWMLIAAAAVQVAIWGVVNWYRLFGPYLIVKLEDLSTFVLGVAPFLLAAAVLVSAPRWPGARRWLYSGAALAALHGVLQTATGAWWAWNMTNPVAAEGALQVALVAASLTAVTAAALAPLCLAAGLRREETTRRAPPIAVGIIVAVGLVAAAASLGPVARELAIGSEVTGGQPAIIALWGVNRLLTMVGALALVVLGLAALRAIPLAGILPEMLIAAGATLAAAGMAASWAGQALLSIEAQSEHLLWVFTLPWTVESLGRVVLIGGFAAAALLHASAARSR